MFSIVKRRSLQKFEFLWHGEKRLVRGLLFGVVS